MSIRSYVDTARDETQMDPTNKLRTSSPQALIDTDFEYGPQISKWENLATTNLRPYAYTTNVSISSVTNIATTAGSRTVTVSLSDTSTLSNGLPIVVQDTLNPIANGTFAVDAGSIVANTSFTYTARAAAATTGSIFDTYKSQISVGTYYTNAAIGGAPTITFASNKIKVVTTIPHGLSIGNEIQITGTTATTSGAPNGTWVVSQIDSPTIFYFYSTVVPVGTISGGLVYSRPQGSVLHRPFDGGVIFSSNGMSNYEATTRQTRRYFRYQSGKGIQFSSGTILKPNFQLDVLSYDPSTGLVTVTTKDQHNLQPGSTINISGANEAYFNGTITVYSVTGYNQFTYTPTSTVALPTSTTKASGTYYASIIGWYGASNRLGIFDQQNGLFFEFDGTNLYAVRRNSTFQLSGRVTVSSGSATVTQATGFTTAFSEQLNPGDFVVIRGQSYRVDAIASDTSLTISPAYRGADNVTAAVMSKTIDTKIPQSQWNLDKLNGVGSSGYTLDLSRMQMFYIDFSWYGAGFVRWGLRTTDGNVTYVHKMQNNNVNFEAYMRSGNLPGRYESITQPQKTTLSATLGTSDTTLNVASTSGFPSSGTLVIKGSSYEYVNYSGITSTSFTGLTRQQAGATVATGLTTSVGSNSIVNTAAFSGVQVGQRVVSNTASAVFPDGTFVSAISADLKTVTLTQPLSGNTAATSVTFIPMGNATIATQNYTATNPIAVEQAFPTFAPTISHWGTSVIMDGRFDDDKSLLFTYGQTAATTIPGTLNAQVSLLSIRIAPSVDNGKGTNFGRRDLTNRMQLVPRTLDIVTTGTVTPLLISMSLNGVPVASTTWSAVSTGLTSSLAQVADHGSSGTTVTGGETVGGFFVSGTASIDLSLVRDLGNSILGGGGTTASSGVYPDGPDVLTIQVTNLSTIATAVRTRLAWTEAQA